MKKIYCIICGKYKKFEKPKISYLKEKRFKEEQSIEIIKNSWFNRKYIITLKIWLKET